MSSNSVCSRWPGCGTILAAGSNDPPGIISVAVAEPFGALAVDGAGFVDEQVDDAGRSLVQHDLGVEADAHQLRVLRLPTVLDPAGLCADFQADGPVGLNAGADVQRRQGGRPGRVVHRRGRGLAIFLVRSGRIGARAAEPRSARSTPTRSTCRPNPAAGCEYKPSLGPGCGSA